MKTFIVLLGFSMGILFFFPVPERKIKSKITGSSEKGTINFETQVQPILQKNCSPCHFPGGKLFAKLPFDKSETIISHVPGILKRIKKEEEANIIKRFATQNKVVALK